ncbi:MAG: hypothetical protein D6814_16135, partial [Calditrichaeota bacterium]
RLDPRHDARKPLEDYEVILVDQRALTLLPGVEKWYGRLQEFAKAGGHLVIFPQDPQVWNAHPLWPGLSLRTTLAMDEHTPVQTQAEHSFLTSPNKITAGDWQNWLYARGYSIVSGPALPQAEVPLKTADGIALLLTQRLGQGRITYVNLALKPQLLNIHAGAFRLLANILSCDPAGAGRPMAVSPPERRSEGKS